MEWTPFLILMAIVIGLFFWNRSESRSDYKFIASRTDEILDQIRYEIKDLQSRICNLEEKIKGK